MIDECTTSDAQCLRVTTSSERHHMALGLAAPLDRPIECKINRHISGSFRVNLSLGCLWTVVALWTVSVFGLRAGNSIGCRVLTPHLEHGSSMSIPYPVCKAPQCPLRMSLRSRRTGYGTLSRKLPISNLYCGRSIV